MLPKLPAPSVKRSVDAVAFLGLNRTENTREGEMRDTQNLSTEAFPCLVQRRARVDDTAYRDPTDLFEWDGHLLVADGGVLKLDGVAIDNVTPGKKQFAVVNTKLCVWPDKVYIDLTNNRFGHLDAEVRSSGGVDSVAFTETTLKAAIEKVAARDLTYMTFRGDASAWNPAVYTYGTDRAEVEACFSNGAWSFPAGMEKLHGFMSGSRGGVDGAITAGDIFIPVKSGNSFAYAYANAEAESGNRPDKSGYNTEGYYAVFTRADPDVTSTTDSNLRWHFDVYQKGMSAPVFSGVFRVGDAVSVSGVEGYEARRAIVRAVDDQTNTLTFDAGTFPGAYTGSDVVTVRREVPDLDFICAKDNRLWGVSNSQRNEAYNAQTGQVETFTSRVIYASALGDPMNWWVFDGVDTDSWQVAVGSEGDFTAITALDGVCCWKENRLHKVFGAYPSEYYMSEYQVDGVAAGSERSCTVVNDVLYYVGRNGVYAYAGSRPREIGRALGEPPRNAAGCSDGERWYLSGTRGYGTKELLTFDLRRGLWMREDATDARAFAFVGGRVCFVAYGVGRWIDGVYVSDARMLRRTDPGRDGTLQWYAEFCPFYETGGKGRRAGTAMRRRRYLRTFLRLDMAAGSSVSVAVRWENEANWTTLLNEDAVRGAVKEVAVPPRRCDRMFLKVSGRGLVTLRGVGREYVEGSGRP